MQEYISTAQAQSLSVDQAFAQAWDQGVMLCSRRSWWRIAKAMPTPQTPAVKRANTGTGTREKPVLRADGPHQVWSWDITDLPTIYTRKAYKLYAVMDIYSRLIVGYRVEEREADHLAVEMFKNAIGTHPTPRTVHSDSGPSMRSHAVRDYLNGQGVELSFIRPSVSNDNAYSESLFATIKTGPRFPGHFTSIEHAREWAETTIESYNRHHHHCGLGLFTPAQIADGSWERLWQARQDVLEQYYTDHPERFHTRPSAPKPPVLAGINHHDQ